MIHTNPKIIGITGGIASGKSTICNFIKDKGYKVIDADEIAKNLMEKGEINYKKIVEYFGEAILDRSGEIDRWKLGRKVFSDPEILKVLNDITHPCIFEEIIKGIERNSKEKVIFLDIPLLFEEYENILKYNIYFDEIWLVFVDRDIQIDRLMKRNNLTKKEAIDRIDSQISIDKKKEKSDRIILNLGSIDSLKENIDLLLEGL